MKNRRRERPHFLVASLLLLAPCLRPAAAQLVGPEFQVNTHTTGAQYSPAVAAHGSGNFVVVWTDHGQPFSHIGVFGQRFNSAGILIGSEFRVSNLTTSPQGSPAVAADASGNFVVVWEGNGQDGSDYGVVGRRFDSMGIPVGSVFQVNTYPTGAQRRPAVAADASGNLVVVWNSFYQDGSIEGIFGQRFSSAGNPVGKEFQVNTYTTSSQEGPKVAAGGSGNFVVVWNSYTQDGSISGVFGQRFDSAGSKQGIEFQVNSYTTGGQNLPEVAADGTSSFVVTWMSYGQDASSGGVFGQRFDSAGSPAGSEFQVNTYTTNEQAFPAVTADGSGNFVVAWYSFGQNAYGDVFGQRFSSAGRPVGSEFQVNNYTTNSQVPSAVAADGAGNFVVAWTSYRQDGSTFGVFGQRLSNWILIDGFEAGDACAWSAAVGGGCP